MATAELAREATADAGFVDELNGAVTSVFDSSQAVDRHVVARGRATVDVDGKIDDRGKVLARRFFRVTVVLVVVGIVVLVITNSRYTGPKGPYRTPATSRLHASSWAFA